MTAGLDIVAEARTWKGVRWDHQGRSRSGVDCAGLVLVVGWALGWNFPDVREYSLQAVDESMLALCEQHLDRIDDAEARPGDVAMMAFGTNRHIGILGDYTHGGHSLVHAYSKAPHRVTEHRFCDEWLRAVGAQWMATFRFPGVLA